MEYTQKGLRTYFRVLLVILAWDFLFHSPQSEAQNSGAGSSIVSKITYAIIPNGALAISD